MTCIFSILKGLGVGDPVKGAKGLVSKLHLQMKPFYMSRMFAYGVYGD